MFSLLLFLLVGRILTQGFFLGSCATITQPLFISQIETFIQFSYISRAFVSYYSCSAAPVCFLHKELVIQHHLFIITIIIILIILLLSLLLLFLL